MCTHLYPRPLPGILAIAFLFSVNLTSASTQVTQAENSQSDAIRGIVVNSVTHEPVGRALVYSPDNRFATMTDGEGRFEFTFASAETEEKQGGESGPGNISSTSSMSAGGTVTTYQSSPRMPNRPDMLMAKKPGFLTEQDGVQNSQPATRGKEITISLTPEALVVGRVTLPTSEASEAIQLELYRRQVQDGLARWTLMKEASTRTDGEFRFAELPAGTYKLLTREEQDRDPMSFDPRGQRYGYPPVYFPNASDFAAGGAIQLTAGQIFQADISLVRQPYYPVKVAVTNSPPQAGIRVDVSSQGHRGPGYSLGYNSNDEMIEGMLPNGNYTVEASAYGLTAMSGSTNISVKGAAVEGARMAFMPAASIPVNVKEEFTAGKEANSPRVTIHTGGMGRSQRQSKLNVNLEAVDDFVDGRNVGLRPASGSDDSSLVLDNVLPGRYWVRAYAFHGFVASISSGEIDLLHQPLVVAGGSSSPIEITLRDDTAEIDGTVEGAATSSGLAESLPSGGDGGFFQPMASSTHVYCVPLPDSSGEFRDVWVGPDGKFGQQELPPGTYRMLAFDHPQPELEYRDPEAMRAYDAKGQVVRLVGGQKEHLHLQLISNSE
jgi:hypothetical protein